MAPARMEVVLEVHGKNSSDDERHSHMEHLSRWLMAMGPWLGNSSNSSLLVLSIMRASVALVMMVAVATIPAKEDGGGTVRLGP